MYGRRIRRQTLEGTSKRVRPRTFDSSNALRTSACRLDRRLSARFRCIEINSSDLYDAHFRCIEAECTDSRQRTFPLYSVFILSVWLVQQSAGQRATEYNESYVKYCHVFSPRAVEYSTIPESCRKHRVNTV